MFQKPQEWANKSLPLPSGQRMGWTTKSFLTAVDIAAICILCPEPQLATFCLHKKCFKYKKTKQYSMLGFWKAWHEKISVTHLEGMCNRSLHFKGCKRLLITCEEMRCLPQMTLRALISCSVNELVLATVYSVDESASSFLTKIIFLSDWVFWN